MVGLSFQDSSPWSYEEISRGFRKRVIGEPLSTLAALDVTVSGQHRRQCIVHQGILVRGTTDVLTTDDSVAVAPYLSSKDPMAPSHASSDLALMEALEKRLISDAATGKNQMDYMILNDLAPQTRSALGLPDTVTITNESLTRIRQRARDLQPRLICLSRGESFDILHKSNADLQSATVLWRGHDIVWLVVSPRHSFILETRLNDYLGLEQQCSQYIRHEEIIVPPSTLKSWKIDFSLSLQAPGEMVTTDYQAYHYAWRLGPSLTETMVLYDSVWVWPPKYEDCRQGNWKCETARSLVGTVDQRLEDFCPPAVEIMSHEQTTNNALESSAQWDHQGVEVWGDHLYPDNPLQAFVVDSSCSPPHDDIDEDAPARPAFPPTAESSMLSHDASVDTEVKTIASDGLGNVKSSTTSMASPLQSQNESTSPPQRSFHEHLSDIGGFNSPHIHENASDSRNSSQTLLFCSPSRDSIDLSTPDMAELRNVSPDMDYVRSRPQFSNLRLPPPAPTPSNQSTSSVEAEEKNSASEEESDQDSKAGHGSELVGTEISDPEPGGKPQTPATSPEASRDDEILTGSKTIPGKSSQVDAVTISDSPSPERHRLEREDDFISLTPERAVRLRRLDPNIAAKQMAQDLEELVQLGTQYREQIVWKTANPDYAERTLDGFRHDSWLNDDAIMETLYRLASERDDVHVVQSLDFAAAYERSEPNRIRRWTAPALVLIPVHLVHQSHWLLVSVHLGHRRVLIHDGHRPNRRLERFLSALFSAAQGWTTEYRNTLKNDGNNCGVILLKEAEAVLKPDSADLRNFDLLRKRYLLLILSDIMRRYDESCAASPRVTDMGGKVDLHRLASAMGCQEVLEDFLEMIKVTRDEKGKVDLGTQRAFHMYEEAMFHEILNTGYENLLHGVKEALQLYRKETSSINDGGEDDSDNQPPMAREDLQMVFQIYTSASGYHKLASIKQDMAAFRVSRIFHTIKGAAQKEISEHSRAKRRKGAPRREPDKSGPKASGRAYEELLQGWISEEEKGQKILSEIRSRGSHLLHYEAACGQDHPLWMLLPMRNVTYPKNDPLKIQHVESYRKLDDVQTQALVDLVKRKHPQLWNVLPKVAEETARVFRGEQADFAFLEGLRHSAEGA